MNIYRHVRLTLLTSFAAPAYVPTSSVMEITSSEHIRGPPRHTMRLFQQFCKVYHFLNLQARWVLARWV